MICNSRGGGGGGDKAECAFVGVDRREGGGDRMSMRQVSILIPTWADSRLKRCEDSDDKIAKILRRFLEPRYSSQWKKETEGRKEKNECEEGIWNGWVCAQSRAAGVGSGRGRMRSIHKPNLYLITSVNNQRDTSRHRSRRMGMG